MNSTQSNLPHAAGEAAHTPTPWHTDGMFVDVANSPDYVAECFGSVANDNAAFIVRACNSHAALVAALERTEKLAMALIERTESIDAMLLAETGSPYECELGEITALCLQLSENRAALAQAKA